MTNLGVDIPENEKLANISEYIDTLSGSGGGGNPNLEELEEYVNHLKNTLANDQYRFDFEGNRPFPGTWIAMRWNYQDYEEFTLSQDGLRAIKTSDGHLYTFENDGAEISHLWDKEKDITTWGGQPVRWVIYYYTENNIDDINTDFDYTKQCNVIYVFDIHINFTISFILSGFTYSGIFTNNAELLTFDFLSDTRSGINFSKSNTTSYFCWDCYSLQKLPDSLDTSKGTNFNYFCSDCRSLQKLPDNLDTSSGTSFNYFCSDCRSLQKLPDNLNTSSGTDFDEFCSICSSLQKLPDNLDTSKGTYIASFCSLCKSLTQANIKLASQDYNYLDYSGRLTVSSMRYMADNAPTVTDNTIRLGETNIARANKYDPTIIQTFTQKGWTVN